MAGWGPWAHPQLPNTVHKIFGLSVCKVSLTLQCNYVVQCRGSRSERQNKSAEIHWCPYEAPKISKSP